jgi:hypothetical protein
MEPVPSRTPLLVRRTGERSIAPEVAVQYALMIYAQPGYDGQLDGEERAAVVAEYEGLARDPRALATAQLQPPDTATCVRVADGRTLLTDGPFADTKEVFGGIFLIEAANLDDALDLAARIPAARLGGAIEVRPVVPR